VHLARALGDLEPLPPTSIDALHHRYQSVYGQR
jgi:L-ribulose-5-phosphate 4-epimerase